MGRRVAFDEVASTQEEADRLARGGAEDGSYVVASKQSAGHGRGKHAWSSPPGGLYLSVIVPSPPDRMGLLPLAVGQRVASALEERYPVHLRVKWPNDLGVVEGDHLFRKLAGILVDRIAETPSGPKAIVGVGLNVATCADEFPTEVSDRLVQLSDLVGPNYPSLREVEEIVVSAVVDAAKQVDDPQAAASIPAALQPRLVGVGLPINVDGLPAGKMRGVAPDGALAVDVDGAEMLVRSGEVTIEGWK